MKSRSCGIRVASWWMREFVEFVGFIELIDERLMVKGERIKVHSAKA